MAGREKDHLTQIQTHSSCFAKRLVSLDVLRGIAVLLALLQHYGYIVSIWYSSYVKVTHFNDPRYAVHHLAYQEGRILAMDTPSVIIMETLGTWVGHLYLFLAGFNICYKDQKRVANTLRTKSLTFFSLFVFFTIETAIVSPDLGEAFSVYPIQMWMIVLFVLNFCYGKFGIKGIGFLFVFSFVRFILPLGHVSDSLQQLGVKFFHRNWEYDARFEYFIGTGTLGALGGYLYSRYSCGKKTLGSIPALRLAQALSFAGILVYQFFGDLPHFEYRDYFSVEHFFIRMFSGTLYVYFCCIFFTSFFLSLEELFRNWKPSAAHWVGTHSLFVFAFHRILFVHLLMPLWEWWCTLVGKPIEHSLTLCVIQVFVCVLLTYFLHRFKVFHAVVHSGYGALPTQTRSGA